MAKIGLPLQGSLPGSFSDGSKFPADYFVTPNVSEAFRRTVDNAFAEMNGGLILNHDIADAWYFIRAIFTTAIERTLPVTIISGRLRADFYNCFVEQLEALIQKECPVKVYLTEGDTPDTETSAPNKFAEALYAARSRYSQVAHSLVCVNMPKAPLIPHVVYAGENALAFRVENDLVRHEAFGSFGPESSPIGESILGKVQQYIQEIRDFSTQEANT